MVTGIKTDSKTSLQLEGKTFGTLTAISFKETIIHYGITRNAYAMMWLCKCSCGDYKSVKASHLTQRLVKTCGKTECKRKLRNERKY